MSVVGSPGGAIRPRNGPRPWRRRQDRCMPSGASRSMPDLPPPPRRPGHVWVDGRLLPAEAAHISAFDRGFQLGDGVFETLRVRGGRPAELEEHLARLRRSADGLDIALPDGLDDALAAAIREV